MLEDRLGGVRSPAWLVLPGTVLSQAPLLIINMWQKQMFVCPLREHVQANEKPLLGSTFLGAPKSGIQVFLLAVVMQ
jgi:hypothetical protein